MKLYDIVKNLLSKHKEYRDSDRDLIWAVWEQMGYARNGMLLKSSFINPDCPNTETIRRSRQKIQEENPELQASAKVQQLRKTKELTKGTFIYSEETPAKREDGYWEFSSGTARFIPKKTTLSLADKSTV